MPPEAAFVLAAGLGTRMRPLTDATPKALLRVRGRALLDHALLRAREGGARRAVVNVHHLAAQIRAHLAAGAPLPVEISDESEMLLDTGGGAARATPRLGPRPFYTLNSDA
jgi:Nucleoside-diphosphate-sugar pyrophosphorylase involved in lipopolysaccharide biosynthesis/translation initiation factor 2B, gamma/epsilon subunits (eIF-2Bgamma/eIF-2Bepsilon)